MTLQMMLAWVLFIHLLAFWALALVLWLGSELLGIDDISFSHAAYVSLGIVGMSGLLLFGVGFAEYRWHAIESMNGGLGSLTGVVVTQLVVSYCILRYALHTSPGKAVTLCLIGVFAILAAGLLMAVTLRAKVVEIAQVQTAGGAPLVLPAHLDVTCPNCGHTYATSAGARRETPTATLTSRCPNCGVAMQLDESQPTLPGDHVLIDKAAKPNRWQLVAYRAGNDPRLFQIGRVVGLPGETIQLLGGDLFVNKTRFQKEPDKFPEFWRTVYDSLHAPAEPVPEGPQWRAVQNPKVPGNPLWEYSDGKWTCAALKAKAKTELEFNQPLTDRDPFNSTLATPAANSLPVRDVCVTCTVQSFQGTGYLGFYWNYGGTSVAAKLALNGNQIDLFAAIPTSETDPDPAAKWRQPKVTAELAASPQVGDSFAFGVRDGTAFVLHNGQVRATLSVEPSDLETAIRREQLFKTETAAQPDRPWQPNQLKILADACAIQISRIVIHRDLHYPSLKDLKSTATERNPLSLEANEYMILADNPTTESDSRSFGPIDRRNILGPLRWICWPRDRWQRVP